MKRRDFLATSALAGAAPLAAFGTPQDAEPEYYELRRYRLLYGAKQQLVHDFLKDAALPALNRIGIGPVGVFTVMYGRSEPTLYVLLPHRDLQSVALARRRLAEDKAYRETGAAFLDAPMSDPAFVRMESSLLRSFAGMPKLEVPPQTAGGRPRIFEFRIYESHGDPAALRKIEMFNRGGEIPIFRRTGLQPVFFAETLIGPDQPNLAYLLVFDSLAARDEAWDRFSKDPDWVRLREDPYYADTVSSISDLILRPTGYSQL